MPFWSKSKKKGTSGGGNEDVGLGRVGTTTSSDSSGSGGVGGGGLRSLNLDFSLSSTSTSGSFHSSSTSRTTASSSHSQHHHHQHHYHAPSTAPSSSKSVKLPLLHTQFPTPCPQNPATKIRLSLLSLAMLDALGAPGEFKPRFSYPFISSMLPIEHFGLPAGTWTDDTSMTLCLAHSLATFEDPEVVKMFSRGTSAGFGSGYHGTGTGQGGSREAYKGGFDEISQLENYTKWWKQGFLSSTGACFDIGTTTRLALQIFLEHQPAHTEEQALVRIRNELDGEKQFSGNGSVMRVLPVGLAYWRDEERARLYARRSSQATHPSVISCEACEFWTGLIATVMEKAVDVEADDGRQGDVDDDDYRPRFSKLSLMEYISTFPFQNVDFFQALHMPFGVPPKPEGRQEREKWFWKHHPLLKSIAETQALPPHPWHPSSGPKAKDKDKEGGPVKFPYTIPSENQVPSTGYVVHTVVAALYCFFATRTFEEGALMVVNLGNDADTVAAVYGGLAGVWYSGEEGGKAEGVFWTKRVREWWKVLRGREMIDSVAEELVTWEARIGALDI